MFAFRELPLPLLLSIRLAGLELDSEALLLLLLIMMGFKEEEEEER